MNEIVARPELVDLADELARYLIRDDSVNDDEDEGYDYPQLEVEHDEMHGLWWHSLSAKAIEVSFQADMKFWYIEP